MIPLFATGMYPSMPHAQKRDDIEDQDREEAHNERDPAKPYENELAVARACRRLGNTDNAAKSPE
jgi:hypothetical protein